MDQQEHKEGRDLKDDLLRLFYRHDPMELAASGAPENEYLPEVEALSASLHYNPPPNEDDLCTVIHTIVTAYFSPLDVGPRERFKMLAQDVWELWAPNA